MSPLEYSEYPPSRLQCHRYTARPCTGAQSDIRSPTVSVIVVGTPCAVVVDEPKLDRMSLRTIPLAVSTFTPFEPSPG